MPIPIKKQEVRYAPAPPPNPIAPGPSGLSELGKGLESFGGSLIKAGALQNAEREKANTAQLLDYEADLDRKYVEFMLNPNTGLQGKRGGNAATSAPGYISSYEEYAEKERVKRFKDPLLAARAQAISKNKSNAFVSKAYQWVNEQNNVALSSGRDNKKSSSESVVSEMVNSDTPINFDEFSSVLGSGHSAIVASYLGDEETGKKDADDWQSNLIINTAKALSSNGRSKEAEEFLSAFGPLADQGKVAIAAKTIHSGVVDEESTSIVSALLGSANQMTAKDAAGNDEPLLRGGAGAWYSRAVDFVGGMDVDDEIKAKTVEKLEKARTDLTQQLMQNDNILISEMMISLRRGGYLGPFDYDNPYYVAITTEEGRDKAFRQWKSEREDTIRTGREAMSREVKAALAFYNNLPTFPIDDPRIKDKTTKVSIDIYKDPRVAAAMSDPLARPVITGAFADAVAEINNVDNASLSQARERVKTYVKANESLYQGVAAKDLDIALMRANESIYRGIKSGRKTGEGFKEEDIGKIISRELSVVTERKFEMIPEWVPFSTRQTVSGAASSRDGQSAADSFVPPPPPEPPPPPKMRSGQTTWVPVSNDVPGGFHKTGKEQGGYMEIRVDFK